MTYLIPDSELGPDLFNERGQSKLPGLLGFEITDVSRTNVAGQFEVKEHHHAPNGFLHGGTVVAFADTLSGYATVANLPAGSAGFTTIELKTNFFSTTLDGLVSGIAEPIHIGRTTQVWDVEVKSLTTGKRMASFRCTNLVLMS